MKILKIAYSEINLVDISKDSKNFAIDTILPITTYKFWKRWVEKKLVDAGFDINETVERFDSYINGEIVFIQRGTNDES